MTWIGAILICFCGIITTHKTATHPVPEITIQPVGEVTSEQDD
jgi:hypothetical protein